MTDDPGNHEGDTRRHILDCVIWVGIGVFWTAPASLPKSLGVLGRAFVEISDSDIGFDKPGNAGKTGWSSFEGRDVIWHRADDIAGTMVAAKVKLRSKVLNTDDEFSVSSLEVGQIACFCRLSPRMKGWTVSSR